MIKKIIDLLTTVFRWILSVFLILMGITLPLASAKKSLISSLLLLLIGTIANPLFSKFLKKYKLRLKKRIAIPACVVLFITTISLAFSNSDGSQDISNSGTSDTSVTYNSSVDAAKTSTLKVDEVNDIKHGAIEKSDAKPAVTADTTNTSKASVSISEGPADLTGNFWVEFIDVGQGDAALIQCDSHYMMIDGGPSDASSVIYTILKNKNIDYLDYMIATHPDADHIGGLSGALNYSKAGICYCPVLSYDTKTFNSLVKYLNTQNCAFKIPDITENLTLGGANIQN